MPSFKRYFKVVNLFIGGIWGWNFIIQIAILVTIPMKSGSSRVCQAVSFGGARGAHEARIKLGKALLGRIPERTLVLIYFLKLITTDAVVINLPT